MPCGSHAAATSHVCGESNSRRLCDRRLNARDKPSSIYNVAVGESLTFARKTGLDAQQVWDLLATSPVIGTGVFKLRGKFMVDRKYLPATMKVEVWQKDMQVIGDMARAVGCPTPLFSACAPVYNAAMAQGFD